MKIIKHPTLRITLPIAQIAIQKTNRLHSLKTVCPKNPIFSFNQKIF